MPQKSKMERIDLIEQKQLVRNTHELLNLRGFICLLYNLDNKIKKEFYYELFEIFTQKNETFYCFVLCFFLY